MDETTIARANAAAEKAFPDREGTTPAVINAFREAFIMGYAKRDGEK